MRRGIDAVLGRRGYAGADLELARGAVLDWARARARGVRGRRGVVGGLGVLVTRPGRAELVPLEAQLPAPGEVTVELLVSAISAGTERAQWLRLPNARPQLPFAPGYSGAGRVLAVGRGVEGVAPGDLVALPRARHASVATLPAAWAVRVPDGVPLEQAALVYLAVIAGYGVRRAEPRSGEPVCVLGAGPIGMLAHRLAVLAGAGPVTVVAASRRREEQALRAGAASFVLASDGLDGLDAAAVIEATGDPEAIASAVAAARDGGTVVLLGSPRGVSRAVPVAEIQRRGLRLVGAHVSALATQAKRAGEDPFRGLAETFLAGLAGGRLRADDLAGEAVDPREIALLYRRLARGELTAAHLDWRLVPAEERLQERRLLSAPLLPATAAGVAAVPPVPSLAGSRRLRFAVVGCGDIGAENARAVAGAANAELALLHDAEPALAEAAAVRAGGTVVDTLDAALDADRVDAVFLSVPHDVHAPLAVRAAEAGLHVVVEKPLAVDLDSALEAVEAAERARVELSVCFPYRYQPGVAAARALVDAGSIGPFRGAALVFHADKPASYWVGGFSGRATSPWRSTLARAGGGVLIMNLTHYVDLVRHVTGAVAEWVTAVARTDAGAEVEDAVALTVTYAGGGTGSFAGSAGTRGAPGSRFEVWGETGTIQLEPEARVYTERAVSDVVTGRWNALPGVAPELESRTLFVERFAAAVLAAERPDVTAADGLAVQAFVEAAYRSVREGRPVRVEPAVARENV